MTNPSSKNALKHGLYTYKAFILPNEIDEYQQTVVTFMRDLNPEGALESLFTDELINANWRLRRCNIVEGMLAAQFDDIDDTEFEKQQKSVDRARAQSHSIIRRCVAELRKLQTERRIRTEQDTDNEGIPMLADTKHFLMATRGRSTPSPKPEMSEENKSLRDFELMLQKALQLPDDGLGLLPTPKPKSSFCKPSAAPAPPAATLPVHPRNAACPCGSGQKFKRCCGKNAPPLLNIAA